MAKPELRPLGWEDEEPFPDTIAALLAWIKPEGYEVAVLTTTNDEYLPDRRKSCRERLDAMNLRVATWLVWKGIAERPEWFGTAFGNPAERLLAWYAWLSTLAARDDVLGADPTPVQDAVNIDATTKARDAWLIKQWEKGKTLQQILNAIGGKSKWDPPSGESGLRYQLDAAYKRAGKTRPNRRPGRRHNSQ